jgi:hypothetical protein
VAVYLTSRLKQSPVIDGRYLSAGDRIDELGLDDAYVARLLRTHQATTTPPGEPEPPELPDPLPAYPEPSAPTGRGAWIAPDLDGIWPHKGRMYEPGARIDHLVDAEVVERMVGERRAVTSKPKTEGRSWRLSTVGTILPDGRPTAAPVAYGRREIEGVRRS